MQTNPPGSARVYSDMSPVLANVEAPQDIRAKAETLESIQHMPNTP